MVGTLIRWELACQKGWHACLLSFLRFASIKPPHNHPPPQPSSLPPCPFARIRTHCFVDLEKGQNWCSANPMVSKSHARAGTRGMHAPSSRSKQLLVFSVSVTCTLFRGRQAPPIDGETKGQKFSKANVCWYHATLQALPKHVGAAHSS